MYMYSCMMTAKLLVVLSATTLLLCCGVAGLEDAAILDLRGTDRGELCGQWPMCDSSSDMFADHCEHGVCCRILHEEHCMCERGYTGERCDEPVFDGILSKFARDESVIKRSTGCPNGFEYVAAVNGCYKMVTDKLSWNIAGLRCRALHSRAHLVIIESDSEQRNVVENIAKHYSNRCGGLGFWMGGQRITPGSATSEFVWKIINGESYPKMYEMTYTQWAPGQPDNDPISNIEESCLHAWQDKNYGWNDYKCWRTLCSICEIDL